MQQRNLLVSHTGKESSFSQTQDGTNSQQAVVILDYSHESGTQAPALKISQETTMCDLPLFFGQNVLISDTGRRGRGKLTRPT